MNLKPYLQLDVTKPTAAKHAKMSLRMLKPWHGEGQDPMHLSDEKALAFLEEFAKGNQAPRWFRKRFEHHNRERRRDPPSTLGAAPRADESTRHAFNASVGNEAKMAAVCAHRLLWDRDPSDPTWSVREALKHAKGKQAPLSCLKEMLGALGAIDGDRKSVV